MSADDVLPNAAQDVELRHGYTLSQVRGLTVWSVMRSRYNRSADFDERLEAAWHAIIEHLYTCDEPPAISDVVKVAWRAIARHVSEDEHFHRGYSSNRRDRDAPFTTGFMRYWHDTGRPRADEHVIERLALAQIWPRLRPKDRELLAAMAEHEDYGQAAAALGKSRHSYATEIGRARRAFRELWHEGETPSRPWGADRRPRTGDRWRPSVTYRLTVRRRHNLAPAPAVRGINHQS
jgi:hypothetical protein